MQEERRRRTWEAPDVPAVENDGVWSTTPEARQGKPGHRTMLEPTHCGSTRARQVEEYCDRESPPHGEGLDGSTQPGKDTHPGYVGPESYEPTSLRAIATRILPCADASATEEPDAGKLHVRDCTGGVGQPAFLPWRPQPSNLGQMQERA